MTFDFTKAELIPGYQLQVGSPREGKLLLQFLQLTYQELFPHQQDNSHLAATVERYLSEETPLWWVVESNSLHPNSTSSKVACLWMGTAIDQIQGEPYTYIFLIYVVPEHRRKGIGSALITQAQNWAKAKGNGQIGLNVFTHNHNAMAFYESLGFQSQSLTMVKSLRDLL